MTIFEVPRSLKEDFAGAETTRKELESKCEISADGWLEKTENLSSVCQTPKEAASED